MPRRLLSCGQLLYAAWPIAAELSRDLGGDRQARRQARRFDAEQVDQPRQAVVLRPIDAKIRRRPVGAADLGPDASVARRQSAIIFERRAEASLSELG